MHEKPLSLHDLNNQIKYALNISFPDSCWIVAEISEVNTNRSGHCYMELIEKEADTIIAKARATIWSRTFRMLKPYFETTTGQSLSAGIKVLVNATVEFHEVYGFSLNIKDIDPVYTLGELARKRLEIIKQLEDDGVMEMNKEIEFPLLPQKIAIISSDTAAGYGDFIQQLDNNQYNYRFYHKLFPAFMQGDRVEESITNALDRIFEYEDFFDVVVIIRGGGSQAELSCFDNYRLAYYVTQFPVPVISGIGHERDETIIDLVANVSVKTPTAVAEFLISKIAEFDNYLSGLQNDFVGSVEGVIAKSNQDIELLGHKFMPLVKQALSDKNAELKLMKHKVSSYNSRYLQNTKTNLVTQVKQLKNSLNRSLMKREQQLDLLKISLPGKTGKLLTQQQHFLNLLENKTTLLDPQNILKRGYSLTTKDGKVIKNAKELNRGDNIETHLAVGKVESKVIKTQA